MLNVMFWSYLLFSQESELCCIHNPSAPARAVLWCAPDLNGGHRYYLHFFFLSSHFKIISIWNLVACFIEDVVFVQLILQFPVKWHDWLHNFIKHILEMCHIHQAYICPQPIFKWTFWLTDSQTSIFFLPPPYDFANHSWCYMLSL